MECHSVPLPELPHQTLLYSTYVNDFAKLSDFYPVSPDEPGIRGVAERLRFDATMRRSVVEVLRRQNQQFGGGPAAARSLDRLAEGAAAVVTGQQAALFSGPAFSLYKAVTAIQVAGQLTERRLPAVPIFWMATEDHDLAEVQHATFLGAHGSERFELQPSGGAGARIGKIALGDAAPLTVTKAAELLEGPGAETIALALAESYGPEETFGSAFGKLIARLFREEGLIVLDPLDAELHRLALPVYQRAIEEHEAISADLLARSKQLEKSQYHVQVKVTANSTTLFLDVDGQRLPLKRRNHGFEAGEMHFSADELLKRATAHPEDLSPNALLRPVVQDSLFPTVASVAGPAEIAYYAQSEVLYRRLLGRMPAILPRGSFTLVEPQIGRLLKKYQLDVRDVWRGRQHLRTSMEREFLPRPLASRFDKGERQLRKFLGGLRESLMKLDSTLSGSVDTAERKMLYQFGRLRGKTARAENFRAGVFDAHERQLTEALYPQRGIQERIQCLLPFLARNGLSLLGELARRSGLGPAQHQILFL